jgi:hypothetical protein
MHAYIHVHVDSDSLRAHTLIYMQKVGQLCVNFCVKALSPAYWLQFEKCEKRNLGDRTSFAGNRTKCQNVEDLAENSSKATIL